MLPGALHSTVKYVNNRLAQGPAPTHARGKKDRSLRSSRGHAFIQNLRRGHYELATDATARDRVAVAFTELALAI